jgi:hypothetical protein
MLLKPPSYFRRWRITLVVLAGVMGIWIWQSKVDRGLTDQAHDYVVRLVSSVRSGSGGESLLSATNPLVAAQLARRLEELKGRPGMVTVDVTPGDHPIYGNSSATHQALIRLDGRPVLGLRLFNSGDKDRIAVMGLWQETSELDPMTPAAP